MSTIFWQDGFDLYTSTVADLSMNYLTTGRGSSLPSGGRFGGGAYRTEGGQPGIWRNVGVQTDLWASVAVNVLNVASADYFMVVFGTNHASNNGIENAVTYNPSSGVWKLFSDYLGSQIGSSVNHALSAGWHWLDVRLSRDASAGVCEVWVDDIQIMNKTGINTKPFTSSDMIYVGLGDAGGNNTNIMTVDDLFVADFRVGDSRIETLVPTSDASPNDGVPSTGVDHFAVVDEAQWNTSDYITMPNTSGDKEVFGHGSIVSTPATVHAVKVYMVSEKTDAGAFALEPLVVSSGTEGDGASQNLATSWGVQSAMFQLDPHTSAAWAYAAANAAKIGYKVP